LDSKKQIIIKKEDQVARGWYYMIGVLFGTAMICIMLYGLFFDNHNGSRIDDYLTILFPLTIGTLIIAQKSLWWINGKDIIEIFDNHLTIQSKGSIFHLKAKSFQFESHLRVEKIKRDSLKIERNRMVMKGLDGYRKFGQGLNERQTDNMMKNLNNLIQEKIKNSA